MGHLPSPSDRMQPSSGTIMPANSTLRIDRTKGAITWVLQDLRNHVEQGLPCRRDILEWSTKSESAADMAKAYIEAMPRLLKIKLGREGGVLVTDLIWLAEDHLPCKPDSEGFGAYHAFGVPKYANHAPVPTPGYGGESCSTKGMAHRVRQHKSKRYRSKQQDKVFYQLIDDPDDPDDVFVFAMFKRTEMDVMFCKVAEFLTCMLLGLYTDGTRTGPFTE